jgi:hypothetical protein
LPELGRIISFNSSPHRLLNGLRELRSKV